LPKLLKTYLIVTGALSFVALAFPALVVIGMFLIIPGLILGLAPTAFLWGCIYAVAYWIARSLLRPALAVPVALLLGALALWLIPQPSVLLAKAMLARYELANVRPGAPIRPQGDIRIDTQFAHVDNASWDKLGFWSYSCDNRCLALLFEPGVRSVTMTSTVTPTFEDIRDGDNRLGDKARTYRLLPKTQCGDHALEPDIAGLIGQFGRSLDDNRAIAAEWGLKLTTDVCLVGEAPIGHYDMLIRTGAWRSDKQDAPARSSWGWPTGDASANFGEIRGNRGKVLFRRFNLAVRALSVPLFIDAQGGIENFRFGWGTRNLPPRISTNWEDPIKDVDAALSVQRTLDPATGLISARKAVRAALDAPSGTDAVISPFVGNYMDLLAKADPTPEDMALIVDLLQDTRLTDFRGVWVLPKKLTDTQLKGLLPLIIHKLSILPDTVRFDSSALGSALEKWPQGSFSDPDHDTLGLLADPMRRRRATGLIARLSDMGARGAPMIADIVAWHAHAAQNFNSRDPALSPTEEYGGFPAHQSTVSAGVTAMCRLGPLAGGQLPKMIEIEQRFGRGGFERRDWDRMILRIGKPLAQIRKPSDLSGSEENYRHNLTQWLARFDPERSCK